MKWRLVVTRPFHLHRHFSPDYRAGGRGDYLPTGISLCMLSLSFCPFSQTLCVRRVGGATRRQCYTFLKIPFPVFTTSTLRFVVEDC